MKKIYRYVLKIFVSPLLATFFVALFVLLMQFLWRYVEDIVGKGLEFSTLVEFFTYSILTLVPMALPLAILLASLMTFGNLGERLELLSIKAAGVSLFKIMSPLIVVVFLISIVAFFFSNNIVPHSMSELRALMHEIQNQRPELTLKERVFDYSMEDMAIKVGEKANDGSMLYDIMIYDHRDISHQGSVTVADSGTIVFSEDRSFTTLTLYSGYAYSIVKEEGKRYDTQKLPYRRDIFEKQVVLIENTDDYQRPDAEIYGNNRQSQSLSMLSESVHKHDSIFTRRQKDATDQLLCATYIASSAKKNADTTQVFEEVNLDSLFILSSHNTQQSIIAKAMDQAVKVKNIVEPKRKDLKYSKLSARRFMAERHRRLSIPFACFAFFFIGAPLGAIIRKGGFGMPVVVSILFFIVYYMLDTFGYKFATESFTSVWFGTWMSSILISFIGGFLTWKAATDSVIMDTESYRNFFKKINVLKKQKNVE